MTSRRPGSINLDVPYNLFQESAEVEEEAAWHGFVPRRSDASGDDVVCALNLLLPAKRPVIFIGHRVTLSETGAELTVLFPPTSRRSGQRAVRQTDTTAVSRLPRKRPPDVDREH
jgi:thiamine pyrophosphate-dependent acetolactate synthase large subunit-like protein